QGRTDHLETRALPEGPGSVGGPIRCPGTFFIGFFEFRQEHRGPMIPYCPGAPGVVSPPLCPSFQMVSLPLFAANVIGKRS
ncbi:unnamed protein product, partial [Staurois parvus]